VMCSGMPMVSSEKWIRRRRQSCWAHKDTVLMYAELLAERAEILSRMDDAEARGAAG